MSFVVWLTMLYYLEILVKDAEDDSCCAPVLTHNMPVLQDVFTQPPYSQLEVNSVFFILKQIILFQSFFSHVSSILAA